MVLSRSLSRSLRAREEATDDEPYSDELEGSSPSVLATGDVGGIASPDPESDAGDYDEEESGIAEEDEDVQAQMSKVSFGALAKAQTALAKQQGADRKRKRGSDTTAQQEDKLQLLRERLRELKAAKEQDGSSKKSKASSAAASKTPKKTKRDESDSDDTSGSDSGSDSDSDASDQPKRARSSKHAPTSQTSKRAVTRRRQVVEVPKRVVRDPRFDPLAGPKPNEAALSKNYGFLKDYRESEMAQLRAAIKASKNEADREVLKRKLLSMESQAKAQAAKDKEQEIRREHRKTEKELVKQGKKPFFLKKSEQKKLALIDRFENMKGKQREHAIERRRKKISARERKSMPQERRQYT